jgi:4-amino-4-deoxy-L-arabinose transferase-like glycosyltransferase
MIKTYQRLLVTSIIIGLLITLWGLGTISLTSLNEGRRALAIKGMFESGNLLLPTLNGELYITKPPLLYWISIGISSLVGAVSELTLRLPSALVALATVWMTYLYTLRRFGAWPALFSAQILMANLGFAMLARRVEIEMLLTALCLGALLSALEYMKQLDKRGWIYCSYFLLALAVLTKGPVALLFVTLPLIVAAIWTKDPSVKKVLADIKGWGLFFVVASSWYLLVSLQLGFDIWATIAKRDMLGKIQAEDTAKPLLSYLGWIAVDFLLLVGLMFIRPRALFKSFSGRRDWMVLITAIAVPFLVFSLFGNKHAKYLLPIYPIIAIMLGLQLTRIFDNAGHRIRALIMMLGVLLPLFLACFYMFAETRVFSYRTSAFSQFHDWDKHIMATALYTYGKTDSRLIFYAKTPIKNLEKNELDHMVADKKSFFIMVEDDESNKIAVLAACKAKEFKPYLKKNKSLIVFGFGEVCNNINE